MNRHVLFILWLMPIFISVPLMFLLAVQNPISNEPFGEGYHVSGIFVVFPFMYGAILYDFIYGKKKEDK